MKCLVILALCLAAVVADVAPDVQTSHYSEHKQTVSDAQKELNQKLDSVQVAVEDDGQQLQSSLEEVDSYGVGTVTASQSGGSDSLSQSSGGPVYVGGSIGESSSTDQQLSSSGGASLQGPYYVSGSGSGNNEHRWRQDSNRDQSFRYSSNGGHSTSGWGSPSIVIPVAGGGGTSESYSQRSEQRIEGSRAPILISSPSGGSSSYYHQRQQRIEQRPQAIVQISQPSGASESYTHTRTVQSQPQTVILSSPGGGTSESYSHRSEKIVKSQPVPVLIAPASSGSESLSEYKKFSSQSQSSPLLVAPSYGHSSHLSLLGSTSQSRPSLHYIPSGSGSISSHSENLISESQVAPTVSAIIAPSTGGSSEYHYSHKSVSQAKPTYIVASPAASSSSSHLSQSLTQQNSGSNLIPLISGGGSSSSLLSGSNLVSSHGLGGSYYPINTGSSLSSSLLAGNTGSSYVPVPIVTGGGQSSLLSESLTSSQGSLGGSYVPVPVIGGGASSSLLSESSLRSSGSVGGYAPVPVVLGGGSSSSLVSGSSLQSSNSLGSSYVPVTSGALLSGNYGSHSSLASGLGSFHNLHGGAQSNLLNYMTESERLARMQSQDIGVGGFLTGSSQLNLESRVGAAGLGGNAALLSGGHHGGAGGGYSSKSWEKSSKWASGTQYGPDGRPKSYNLLSTGEGEEHNINGYKAGFKAATTTIDDDGKVSTYSIHS